MKRAIISLVIVITVALTLLGAMASEEDINTIDIHQITITTEDSYLSINEVIRVQGESNESYDTITVWVHSDADNVNILVDSETPDSITQNGSEYICNISSFAIEKEDTTVVTISYELGKVTEFTRQILRSTNALKVTFDQKELFTGTNLVVGTSITIQLYEPTEPTLNWYIIVIVFLAIILLVVIVMYTFRKQKSVKVKEIAGGSEELLNTKKALLMSLLKDIEKQHRANQISDDTYYKLKECYKQEAVEAMKQLEDMKSKVK